MPYAEIDLIKSWNDTDWQVWWSKNLPVFILLDVTYDVKMAIASIKRKEINI